MGTQWMFLFLFPLLLCQGGLCSKDIDECQTPGICRNGGTCQNTYGGYKCVCTSGWDGDNCEHNIDDCAKAACAGGATCIDKVASFMCLCPPGRTGLLCHLDDACLKNPCHPEATCMTNPLNGRAMCHCQPGYTGATCYEDLDECSLGGLCPKYIHGCQTPGICSNKGTCQNTYGGYKCVCVKGYDGDNCDHNIDECATATCAEGSTCIDQVGTYVCICPPGRTGGNCSKDFDECQTPGICRNGGTCQNTYGGYKCVCVNGWDGDNCDHNIDDCATAVCGEGSTCIDQVAAFMCLCPPGRTGLLCHLDDACLKNPCHPEATCMTNQMSGRAMCHCQPGYTGATCYKDLDECSLGPSPCEHNGQCVNTEGSFLCRCPLGYTGTRCETDQNECLKRASCLDLLDRFKRECTPEFEGVLCEREVRRKLH